MSDSATPWTVARQAPLFVGILQARVLEWGATPFSISSGSSISNYDPYYYPTKKKTCGATPRKCLRSQCLTTHARPSGPTLEAQRGWVGVSSRQDLMGRGPDTLEGSLGGCPLPS